MEDSEILAKAYELFEQGYGTLNRCQKVLIAFRGDMESSREILSNLTLNDFNG